LGQEARGLDLPLHTPRPFDLEQPNFAG